MLECVTGRRCPKCGTSPKYEDTCGIMNPAPFYYVKGIRYPKIGCEYPFMVEIHRCPECDYIYGVYI